MKLRDSLLRPNLKIDNKDSLGRGMELVFTFLVFAGIGLLLDLTFDTLPILTIVFTLLGAVGLFVRAKYKYDIEMARHERERRDAGRSAGREAS